MIYLSYDLPANFYAATPMPCDPEAGETATHCLECALNESCKILGAAENNALEHRVHFLKTNREH